MQTDRVLTPRVLPAVLRLLQSSQPQQQEVAAEMLSFAATGNVWSGLAARAGELDALAAMLHNGRWESRYWAATCLAQLACSTARHEGVCVSIGVTEVRSAVISCIARAALTSKPARVPIFCVV